jgi:hypothetical protein
MHLSFAHRFVKLIARIERFSRAADKRESSVRPRNPLQQVLLRWVGTDLDEVTAYSEQLAESRETEGLQAAVQFEATGQRIAAMDRTVADLLTFSDTERLLLRQFR